MAATPPTFRPVLTIEQVAEILACSPGTVKSRIRTGELRSFKDGRLRRVRGSDLEAYIAGRGSE